jgi:hypothetical protein
MDKDIEIIVNLYDVNKNMKKSKQGLYYNFDVAVSTETEVSVLENDFTATPKDKKRWFLFHATLFSILFSFLIYLFILAGLNNISVTGTIFCGVLTCLSIVGWIFFIFIFYKRSYIK